MAETLSRFGVTAPEDVLKEFDKHIERDGKSNRSDVLRQLMRRYVSEERWREEDGVVYGTVTLMYDHHSPNISKDLTDLQHDHGNVIICTNHVHISHDACLECIVLRGETPKVKFFIDALNRIKGLKSLDTVIASGI
ncbi:nickel-responsive transcriptional regulator NikR [Synergistales bacterium]|nr:nickel-responsive transcriptional regulator NikR [Synergistales bacterium]